MAANLWVWNGFPFRRAWVSQARGAVVDEKEPAAEPQGSEALFESVDVEGRGLLEG
jgi:hypothetical protein